MGSNDIERIRAHVDAQRGDPAGSTDVCSPSNLSELGNEIKTALATASPPSTAMHAIEQLLVRFADDHLLDALADLICSDANTTEVAARTYQHANGFLKIPLLADPSFKLRLHVWWPGVSAAENRHEHRWWFASTVLCGSLSTELWQEGTSPEAKEFREVLYTAARDGRPAETVENGHTRLVKVSEGKRVRGDSYVMAPGTIHRIVDCGCEMTATLVVQAAAARRWNRLFPTPGFDPELTYRYLTPVELVSHLSRFVAAMNKMRAGDHGDTSGRLDAAG